MSEYYKRVMCSEELPMESGKRYLTNKGRLYLSKNGRAWQEFYKVEWWLKPLSMEQHDKEVWNEALEAAAENVKIKTEQYSDKYVFDGTRTVADKDSILKLRK